LFTSDESAPQYKNRKKFTKYYIPQWRLWIASRVALLCEMPWKSACHGVGDTLKRLAANASFQQAYNDQIMTFHQLYEWAQSNIHNLIFDFVTENVYKEEEGLSS
jgi:hypothetical protein